MTQHQTPLDFAAKRLFVDDVVLIKRISEELLRDLPDKDQRAISHCSGHCLSISGFDRYGNAEIGFIDQEGNPHTIWIHTGCLLKQWEIGVGVK